MSFLWTVVLVVHLLVPALCQAQSDDEAAVAASLSLVTKECSSKLAQINSIESFTEFMKHYHIVTSNMAKPKRGILNLDGRLRKCYDNHDALLELEDLITKEQDDGTCQQSYVDKLVKFHQQHVLKRANQSGGDDSGAQTATVLGSIRTSYGARVFSLFAHQVAFNCKKRLLARVELAQSKEDCASVLGSFLPADTLKSVNHGSSMSQSPSSTPVDELAAEEFSNFLRNFKRVDDFAIIGKQAADPEGPYLDVVVSPEVLSKIDRLKSQCRAREPYYSALFAPIATLSQLGYDVVEPSVDAADDNLESGGQAPRILKCWLATAQLCQGILRTNVDLDQAAAPKSTFVNLEDPIKEDDEDDDLADSKLVQIKFGPMPESDVPQELAASLIDLLELGSDHVQEIYQNVIDIVNEKASLKGKMKRKALNWARNFLERHIDIDGKQSEMAHAFMKALTREETETDSAVAFNGKQKNQGVYRPATLITDDADSITQVVSFFVSKQIALIFSSAVAICLSAVFVWFTLYALISSMRGGASAPDANGNFKANWRELRDKRMKRLDDKVKRKGWKDKFAVYRSPTS